MKKPVNRDDYVIMIPRKGELFEKELKTNLFNVNIRLLSNREDVFDDFLPEGYITNGDQSIFDGSVISLLEAGFVKNSELDRFPEDGGYMPKTDPRYTKGIENTGYVTGNSSISVMYYPYHAMLYNNYNQNERLLLCGNIDSAKLCSKSSIKQAISIALFKKNVFAVHAAAVSDAQGAYLFLGGGRAGKTTMYLNLLSKGYMPMNDDIVFLSVEGGEIIVYSLPTHTSIRKESLKYVIEFDRRHFNTMKSGIDNEYYFSPSILSNLKHVKRAKLRKVLIPRIGYDESAAADIDGDSEKKRILRCLQAHNPAFQINHELADMVGMLTNYKSINLTLSEDIESALELTIKSMKSL